MNATLKLYTVTMDDNYVYWVYGETVQEALAAANSTARYWARSHKAVMATVGGS